MVAEVVKADVLVAANIVENYFYQLFVITVDIYAKNYIVGFILEKRIENYILCYIFITGNKEKIH